MSKDFGITSLMNSATANDFKATQIFIASGANVNDKNIANVTSLHLAARNNSYEVAQILIDKGASVNAKDLEGWTPLMRASLSGNPKMIKLLIQNGANIWDKNNFGETALIQAAMADCYDCGKIILENQDTNDYFIKDQIEKSKEIVTKRYNEPFMQLLSSVETKISTIKEPKKIDHTNITQLVYIFTGKSIGKDQMSKISKDNYNTLKEKERKLNKLSYENSVIDKQNTSENIIKEKIINNSNATNKNITSKNSDMTINTVAPASKNTEQAINSNSTKTPKLIEKKYNGPKFVLNPDLSKPIIEKEPIKSTVEVKTVESESKQPLKNIDTKKETVKQENNKVLENKNPTNNTVQESILQNKDIKDNTILEKSNKITTKNAIDDKKAVQNNSAIDNKKTTENKKNQEVKKPEVKEVKKIDKKLKFVLNPDLSKPVIEKEPIKSTVEVKTVESKSKQVVREEEIKQQTKNIVVKEKTKQDTSIKDVQAEKKVISSKPRFILNGDLAKPVVEQEKNTPTNTEKIKNKRVPIPVEKPIFDEKSQKYVFTPNQNTSRFKDDDKTKPTAGPKYHLQRDEYKLNN